MNLRSRLASISSYEISGAFRLILGGILFLSCLITGVDLIAVFYGRAASVSDGIITILLALIFLVLSIASLRICISKKSK